MSSYLLPFLQLWLNDVEQTDADVRIPPHGQDPGDVFVFSGAARDFAYREAQDGGESVFVLKWCLPLISSGRAHRDGPSPQGVEIALMPGSIAKRIGSACAITGDRALERHRDMANRLPGSILFLARDDVRIRGIGDTGVEVEDQREAAVGLCLGSRCDP